MKVKDISLFYGSKTKVKAYEYSNRYFLSIDYINIDNKKQQTLLEFGSIEVLKKEFELFTANL